MPGSLCGALASCFVSAFVGREHGAGRERFLSVRLRAKGAVCCCWLLLVVVVGGGVVVVVFVFFCFSK